MGVLSPTLIGTGAGPVRVADLVDTVIGFSWVDDKPVSVPMFPAIIGETDTMVVLETWFGGGCRDCNHHSNEGLKFYVSAGTEFLLKNGGYRAVEELEPGIRLRVIGRDCGFEEVKSVETVTLEAAIPVYTMVGSENYGLQGPNLPNKVLVHQ